MCKNCDKKHENKYDFIIVGMGAGGATALRLLSDAGFSVAGIEAGGNYDNDPLILESPGAGLLEMDYTWKYLYNQETVPNVDVGGRAMNYTTGRMLGGGTSINGMQYVRGSCQFWDEWASVNGPKWNALAAMEGFKELEKFVGVAGEFDPLVHGTNGKMQIRQAPEEETEVATKFAMALAEATESSVIDDYNDPTTPIGTYTRWSLFQQPNGNRASSSTDFLSDIVDNNGKRLSKDRKVKIYQNATANKVVFDCYKKAIGVEIIQNGKSKLIRTKKEVILCAGIHSNEILQRSGVGDAALLNELKIPVVYNNKNVGCRSKNHLINMAVFSTGETDEPVQPMTSRLVRQALQSRHGGPGEFGGMDEDPNALYLGGAFLPFPGETSRRGFQWIGVNGGPGILLVIFYNLNPESIGIDRIQDKDPLRVSEVSERLFSAQIDLDRIVDVYQQQIVALNNVFLSNPEYEGYQLLSPSLDLINDTDKLKEYIIEEVDHAHHWTGTCRMAPENQDGVVDNAGQVYGVKSVRVADISVAPFQADGNTAGPAFYVGYNIAKQVINKYL